MDYPTNLDKPELNIEDSNNIPMLRELPQNSQKEFIKT